MKHEQIKELQEAIIYHIFMTEYGNDKFRRIEEILPYEVFGAYAKLAKHAY